jgi:hypothetical protein
MKRPVLAALAALGLLLAIPAAVEAQDTDGFDGFIQGGTCASPDDGVRVNLDGGGSHDVLPYHAEGPDGDVLLGYFGSPELPGFGVPAIYTGQKFSLVVIDAAGQQAACGDLLRPAADRYTDVGLVGVQLLPVGTSGVQGFAVLQRTRLQRELDVTPTRVRIVLSTDTAVAAPAQPAAGYNGFVQSGTCAAPTGKVRVNLRSRARLDVNPYRARPDSGDPVTLGYVGSPGAPGFGLAASYTGTDFSLAIADPAGGAVACGDILKPSEDRFVEAGVALVQLKPTGTSGAPGYAVIQRVPLQREVDVTPTRVWIVLFAPPAIT